ncbi:MAG: carboxy terminal-processing peptidase, partial [Chromatiales bacterium]
MTLKKPLLALLCLLILALPALATVQEVPVGDLVPDRSQRQTAFIITKVIDRYHYRDLKLDDELSSEVLDDYLDSLDPNRIYFLQSDIDTFEVYRDRLDEALKEARLEPAFSIFRIYRFRVEDRVAFALSVLNRQLDFTRDEEYRFDRDDVPWPGDRSEQDDLWRKRVKNDILSLRLSGKKEDEIKETLKKRYEGIVTRARQLRADDVFQLFINAYTTRLDPHTSYMSPRSSENFDISMRLSLEGIGAVLSTENEYTEVQRLVKGGPAEQSGQVQAGDRIIGVAQDDDGEMVDVIGWRLQDVVDLIRGSKGTVVRLQLMPDSAAAGGPTREVRLVRNEIKLEDQAASSEVIDGLEGMRIGVIEIPAFYRDFQARSEGDADFRSTTRDVRGILNSLTAEGVDGIVIDLRHNGGGSLSEATELTGLFIEQGPVVQVRDSTGKLELESDPDPQVVYSGPLAVLVDRHSASASEIFAGAIQDYGRGIIIGEPTFGKGTVQTLVDLDRFVRGEDDLGRLRLTMAQFYRVNGDSTQFRGVVPDILFPFASSSDEEGERSLDHALPWGHIKPADFHGYGLGSLVDISSRHDRRIHDDPGFSYL